MKNLNVVPFVDGASAKDVNCALKTAIKAMDQAKHCAVLWFQEIVARQLFQELGYSSVYQYAELELGFSKTRTGNFLLLARKLEELPRLKLEMESGHVGYTKALEVIKVASKENERQWVQVAKTQSRAKLRSEVEKARKLTKAKHKTDPNQGELLARSEASMPLAITTHKITLEMTTEQRAKYEALLEKLHKMGGVPKGTVLADTILQGLAALVSGDEAHSPGVQVHVHQCPDCEKATISTKRGITELTKQEFDHLACDAQIDQPDQKNTATIAPSTRRRVLARDQHRCQAPACSHTSFLEVHHVVPRSRGGGNKPDNLITLCGGCHRRVHVAGGRNEAMEKVIRRGG